MKSTSSRVPMELWESEEEKEEGKEGRGGSIQLVLVRQGWLRGQPASLLYSLFISLVNGGRPCTDASISQSEAVGSRSWSEDTGGRGWWQFQEVPWELGQCRDPEALEDRQLLPRPLCVDVLRAGCGQ